MKAFLTILLSLLFLLNVQGAIRSIDMHKLFEEKTSFWKLSKTEVEELVCFPGSPEWKKIVQEWPKSKKKNKSFKAFKNGDGQFNWTDNTQTIMTRQGNMIFSNFMVIETQIWFRKKSPYEIKLLLYDRKKRMNYSHEAINNMRSEALLFLGGKKTQTIITTGRKPTYISHLSRRNKYGDCTVMWGWSKQKKFKGKKTRVNFIRLSIVRPKKQGKKGRRPVPNQQPKPIHQKDGQVLLRNLPMIVYDPRQDVTCVNLSRLSRYYNKPYSVQHFSQISTAGKAYQDDPRLFSNLVQKLASPHNFRRIQLIKISDKMINKRINRYNKRAKAYSDKTYSSLASFQSLRTFYKSIKSKIDYFRPGCLKEKKYTKFCKYIRTHIDRGHPLTWHCFLGIFDFPPSKAKSVIGHSRIIVGYNFTAEPKKIFFTDPWGKGHEIKQMELTDAWVITMGLDLVLPKIE